MRTIITRFILLKNYMSTQMKPKISRRLLYLILFFFTSLSGYSLVTDGSKGKGIQNDIIPPSPDAAALGKYGQYPVNLNNGLVNIAIPIYTIKLPKFELPISLSYHASGIKVNDISSCVGLGWALNAGGVITRSVRGIPDSEFGKLGLQHERSFYDNMSAQNALTNLSVVSKNQGQGTYDSESDVYYYNVNGLTGSFRYSITGEIIQVPMTNNIITYDSSTDKFTIIANDGTIYYFNDTEISSTNGKNGENNAIEPYTSSWYLTGVRTVDCQNSTDNYSDISFYYTSDQTLYEEDYESYQIKLFNAQCSINLNGNEFPQYYLHSQPVTAVETRKTLLLSAIIFPGGRINFNNIDDRADRRKWRLNNIQVKNDQGEIFKEADLTQTYFTTGGATVVTSTDYPHNYNYRLKLDKVTFYGYKHLDYQNSYKLEYNTKKILPSYYQLNAQYPSTANVNSGYYGQDYWGYYNGVMNDNFSTNIPFEYKDILKMANRNVNTDCAKACILTKVTYPTKGYSTFEYESNHNSTSMGGLRISTIKSCDATTQDTIIKSYTYDDAYAESNRWSNKDGEVYTQGYDVPQDYSSGYMPVKSFMYDYYVSEPNIPLSFCDGASVHYGKVTENLFDGNKKQGKTEFFYTGSYPEVQAGEPQTVNSCSSWKPYKMSWPVDYGWMRGQLSEMNVYKMDKSGSTFQLIKKTINDYTLLKHPTPAPIVGFFCFGNRQPLIFSSTEHTTRTDVLSTFQYNNTVAETGLYKLTKTTETQYTENGNVEQETDYAYDNLDNQFEVSSIKMTQSDKSILKTIYTYPNDLKNDIVYQAMVQKNILTPVVKELHYKNEDLVQSILTNYKNWGSSFRPVFFAPESIQELIGLSKNGITYNFYGYDLKGNITSSSKQNDFVTSYRWAYSETLPVVKAENIDYQSLKSATTDIETIVSNVSDLSTTTERAQWTSFNIALRKSLPNALITTYTYIPLVGMTSKTDPRGITTYYNYDEFGRLINVKNDDTQILNTYDYHYKQ